MNLFGRKRKNGDKKQGKSRRKTKQKLYKTPNDVKLFYVMPTLMLLGFLLLGSGEYLKIRNTHLYQQHIMESSMKYGQELPLWGGDTTGTLSLGHTKLSANGKDFAVEIKYDSDAHTALSSFGNRYALRLVKTEDNHMKVKMRYGLFGTDGSGVLDIHSNKGFTDQAFVVMLVDKGHLVTTDDLGDSGNTVDEEDLDKSITAQLSNADSDSSNSENEDTKKRFPPIYIIRLNAHNAKRAQGNWKTDRDIVEDLFVKNNLAKIEKQEQETKNKLRRGEDSLAEMEKRIKENPDDTVSIDNADSLKDSIESFKETLKASEKNRQKIVNSTIQTNVLDPVQTKYSTYVEPELGDIGGTE